VAFDIKVTGDKEVERALDKLPPDAQRAMVKEKRRLAKNLAAYKRQGKLIRPTIHQSGDRVTAGPHPVLNVTEFGSNRRTGWYADDRFRHSTGRQFRPHNSAGYWWNPTIERSKPDADEAVKRALDDTLNHWSA
jgi:hypothetical protein